MSEQEKKDFLFSIFENTNDSYSDSLNIVLSRLRNSQQYDQAVEENNDYLMEIYKRYSFPNNLQLSPEELNQVIQNVKDNCEYYIYKTVIPRNVRLAEAPSYGMPIVKYDPHSAGAEAYSEFAEEFLSIEEQ